MPEAARTLVKSPPELWAEVSDPTSLARHLGEAGEIRITRLDPEATVVWEGDRIRGTVDLAPAGWGTKVRVTAEPVVTAVEPPAEEPQAAQGTEEPAREAAKGTDNLLPVLAQALRDRCSLGEVCGAMKDVFGAYQQPASF